MNNLFFFLLSLFLSAVFLKAEHDLPQYVEEDSATTVITAGSYCLFLKANDSRSNSYDFYDLGMKDQIICVGTGNYFVVEGEENKPMRQLTDFDITCYDSWLTDHSDTKHEIMPAILGSLDESSGPLMMFSTLNEKSEQGKSARDNKQAQRNDSSIDPLGANFSATIPLRGNALNGIKEDAGATPPVCASKLPEGNDNIKNHMNSVSPDSGRPYPKTDLQALQQRGTLSEGAGAISESTGLLNGQTVRQVPSSQSSSCLSSLTRCLSSFCFPDSQEAELPERRIVMTASAYGTSTRGEPSFLDKLRTILDIPSFRQGRNDPTPELLKLINDTSITATSQEDIIAIIASDKNISVTDLLQVVELLKKQPASEQCTQKQNIINLSIERRKQNVSAKLDSLSLTELYDINRALQSPPSINLGRSSTGSLSRKPDYSMGFDSALYLSLVQNAIVPKKEAMLSEINRNNSAVIPLPPQDNSLPEVFSAMLEFLPTIGINVDETIVNQDDGVETRIAQDSITKEQFLYKQETSLLGIMSGKSDRRPKKRPLERMLSQDDIVPATFQKLPHFVNIKAFIILAYFDHKRPELHYVPAANTKNFISALKKDPMSVYDIQIAAQLMEKPPGEPLARILQSPAWRNLTLPELLPHFDAIATQSFQYLSKAYQEKLAHQFIRPENLIYDIATKKLTIMDASISTKLNPEYGIVRRIDNSGASGYGYSQKELPPAYMSPAVAFNTSQDIKAKLYTGDIDRTLFKLKYGIEVDAYPFARILLELMDPVFCAQVNNDATKNRLIIPDTSSYVKEYIKSPFQDFLKEAVYQPRVALINAFFRLGTYIPKLTAWRSTPFNNLVKAYHAAYPAAEK